MINFEEFKVSKDKIVDLVGGKVIKTTPGMMDQALGVKRDEHHDNNNNGIVDEGDKTVHYW